MDHLRRYADLNRTDIDLEEFSTALALQYMSRLIANGGSDIRRPDQEFMARVNQGGRKPTETGSLSTIAQTEGSRTLPIGAVLEDEET